MPGYVPFGHVSTLQEIPVSDCAENLFRFPLFFVSGGFRAYETESLTVKCKNRMYSLCRNLPDFPSALKRNFHNVSTIASQSSPILLLSLPKRTGRDKEKRDHRAHLEIHGEAEGFPPRGGAIWHSTAVHARRSLT
jgi:hypothetical protein